MSWPFLFTAPCHLARSGISAYADASFLRPCSIHGVCHKTLKDFTNQYGLNINPRLADNFFPDILVCRGNGCCPRTKYTNNAFGMAAYRHDGIQCVSCSELTEYLLQYVSEKYGIRSLDFK